MPLLAGALLERTPGPKYIADLRYAELNLSTPLPKPSTLRRWREKLPEDFQLALRAPKAVWQGVAGGGSARGTDADATWLNEAADALGAVLVVLATGPGITTGQRDRDRLERLFQQIDQGDDRKLAWRPTGLWEPETVQQLAARCGVLAGFDPLEDPTPTVDPLYGSLVAEGFRRSFSHALLGDVATLVQASGATQAYITIASNQSFQEAKLLQSLLQGQT